MLLVPLLLCLQASLAGIDLADEDLVSAVEGAFSEVTSRTEIEDILSNAVIEYTFPALAVSYSGSSRSKVVVFLKNEFGYRAVDISGIEGANLGKLGPFRDYEQAVTEPLRWLLGGDDYLMLEVRTRAWSGGTRYTTKALLPIRFDGQIVWQ